MEKDYLNPASIVKMGDVEFNIILDLDELVIVPTMLVNLPFNDRFSLSERGEYLRLHFTQDQLARVYQKILLRLPDIGTDESDFERLVLALDTLYPCLDDEILRKYHLE